MLKNVGLRVYEKFSPQYYLYQEMHKHQTLEYVKLKRKQYSNLNNKKMNWYNSWIKKVKKEKYIKISG